MWHHSPIMSTFCLFFLYSSFRVILSLPSEFLPFYCYSHLSLPLFSSPYPLPFKFLPLFSHPFSPSASLSLSFAIFFWLESLPLHLHFLISSIRPSPLPNSMASWLSAAFSFTLLHLFYLLQYHQRGCLCDKQPQCRAIRFLTRYSLLSLGMTHSQAATESVSEVLAAWGTRWLPGKQCRREPFKV